MKRKIYIAVLIIIVLLAFYKVFSWISNKNLMEKTNSQLKSLLEPYINNTVVVIDEDKYYLRIKEVKLSDYVGPYKNALKTSAYVSFDIYKDKVSEDNFIDSRGIHMEVWRKDLQSDFFVNGKGNNSSLSYKRGIYDEFVNMIFDFSYTKITKSLSVEELNNGYNHYYGHGRSNEDNIKYNEYGEITKGGEVKYSTIMYAKDLSMKFTTKFYIEDFKQYQEMHIKVDKAEGNYHALWDIKKEDIEMITFYNEGDYEGKKVITDRSTIEELVTYLKSIPFEESENQAIDYEPLMHIQLGDYDYDRSIHLSKDAIYTYFNNALCKGENYVKKIIEILNNSK